MGERNMKFNMKFMIKQWHNNGPKDEKDGPKDRGVHVSMSHQWKMVWIGLYGLKMFIAPSFLTIFSTSFNLFQLFKLHLPQSFSPIFSWWIQLDSTIPSPQPSVMLLCSFSRFSSGCRSLATRKNLLRTKHRTRSSANFLRFSQFLISISTRHHPQKIISQRAWPSLDSRHTEHLTVSPRCEVASVTSA